MHAATCDFPPGSPAAMGWRGKRRKFGWVWLVSNLVFYAHAVNHYGYIWVRLSIETPR